VRADLHAKAPQGARLYGTYFEWGAASQSAPLLVTFDVKSDIQSIKRKTRYLK